MSNGWCTIESDPGVFSELISEIGVKGIQVEELFDLSAESFDKLKPIFGLIFLFKWQKEEDKRPAITDEIDGLFFAKQVVTNACATQAILSVLMNRPEIDLGPTLSEFKSFAKDLPSDIRGVVLGQSEKIREAHNSFARPEPFVFEKEKVATEDDDVYHFIGYVPVNGALYELDGLKDGPIRLDDCNNDNWLDKARPAIQARISRYSQKEIRFNLLALVKSRKDVYAAKLKQVTERLGKARAKLARGGDVGGMDETDDSLPTSEADLKAVVETSEREEKELKENLEAEDDKHKKWKVENVRRKHNYIPFIYNLLKLLAQKGKVQELVKKATETSTARTTRQRAAKEKEKKDKQEKDKAAAATTGAAASQPATTAGGKK